MHSSCKIKLETTQDEVAQNVSPLPVQQPRASGPTRTDSKNFGQKGKGKNKESLPTASFSSEHGENNTSDEYLPELGMTQKQLQEIQGVRPRRKMSGAKRGARKK